ncbi:pectin acetylesterase 3 isoform X1 [Cryptomeria japonica]|uniref:pectin acetylesterase 3 isoform X1 n=1 Tax=Cryptomeria japonica TaxID=3369 RepID=UPI0027DA3C22|nr:pectin acetylesterase 3 isoform X1 [Cryptomeria japonica]
MGALRNPQSVKSVCHTSSVKLIVVIYVIAVSTIMVDAALGSRSRRTKPSAADILVVNLTLVERAAETGAFCLDGTLPAYLLDSGYGSGANNWLVHFEGGGWCNNRDSCIARKTTHRGSSNYMDKQAVFSGILSNKRSENPEFFNWNRVKLMYCDGASFAGDSYDEESGLYFRGQRIWHAMIADLLAKGMEHVEQALLSGCSAGGLATFLHCDDFRKLLPSTATVKCHSDAGFFLDAKDISGMYSIRAFYNDTVNLQGVVKNLPQACASQLNPSQCFFPQYLLPYIQTPLFVLNAVYDTWQFYNILAPGSADPHGHWRYCKMNAINCTSAQLEILQVGIGLLGVCQHYQRRYLMLPASSVSLENACATFQDDFLLLLCSPRIFERTSFMGTEGRCLMHWKPLGNLKQQACLLIHAFHIVNRRIKTCGLLPSHQCLITRPLQRLWEIGIMNGGL